jgi:hypothetical protein
LAVISGISIFFKKCHKKNYPANENAKLINLGIQIIDSLGSKKLQSKIIEGIMGDTILGKPS